MSVDHLLRGGCIFDERLGKKGKSGKKAMKKSPHERMKEIYEAQAGEIRKNISIAAAEIERLIENSLVKARRTELNS